MSEKFPNPQPDNNDKNGLTRRQFLKGEGALMASFALDKALPKTVEAGQRRIDDADVHSPTRGNAEFIRQNDIKVHQETIRVGNEQFKINIFTKEGQSRQKYLVVHDSEDAAFDTGLRAIENGGMFIALESKDTGDESKLDRFMYSFGERETNKPRPKSYV